MYLALVIAALLPAIVLCGYVYKKDRVEKEPIWLLLLLLGLGALSCFPVLYVERGFGMLWKLIFTPFGDIAIDGSLQLSSGVYYIYHFLNYFVGVALVEEGFKFLFLFWATKKSKHFNCLFDGIIYAVFISLGFAALENVFYVLKFGFGNAVMRAILSVPGHMFYAVMMGYYYSFWHIGDRINALERDLKEKNLIREETPETPVRGNIVMCILIPTLAHGFYDFCCTLNSGLAMAAFFLFVVFMYFHCFKKIRKMSFADGYTGNYAQDYIFRKYPELFRVQIEYTPETVEEVQEVE